MLAQKESGSVGMHRWIKSPKGVSKLLYEKRVGLWFIDKCTDWKQKYDVNFKGNEQKEIRVERLSDGESLKGIFIQEMLF